LVSGPPRPALLRYVGLRDAGLGSVSGGHFWTRKGVALGWHLTTTELSPRLDPLGALAPRIVVHIDIFEAQRPDRRDLRDVLS
jgi:hypothetical protein